MTGLTIWTIVLVIGVILHALAQSWYAVIKTTTVFAAAVLINENAYDDLGDDDKKLMGKPAQFMGRVILIAVLIMIAGIIGTVCSVAGMIG